MQYQEGNQQLRQQLQQERDRTYRQLHGRKGETTWTSKSATQTATARKSSTIERNRGIETQLGCVNQQNSASSSGREL